MSGPVKTRETLLQQIAEELKRQEQSRASLADLRARAKLLDRKLDARRKIVLGAALEAHAKLNSAFHAELAKALPAAVRPQDRWLLPEFFPASDPPPIPPQRPSRTPESPAGNTAPAAITHPQEGPVLPDTVRATEPKSMPPARPLKTPREPPSGAAPA
jgi:hypothetical protein